MVYTGSQSTITSRAVLHEVGKHLDITADVSLKMEADRKAVTAPVFVQPDSEQPCLLGMNIARTLGLKFINANGLPLKVLISLPQPSQEQTYAMVCLTQTSTQPGRKGRFLEAKVDPIIKLGTEILFEPNAESLGALGLSAQECLLCVQRDGTVLIPLQNFKQDTVDLEVEFKLGGVEPLQTKFLMQPSDCSLSFPDEGRCSQVTTRRQAKLHEDRKTKLKATLNLLGENLTPEQFQQLEKKLMDNADIFAIDESELGHTTVVKHSIEHSPIKQCPRRTSFVHRETCATRE